MSDPVREIQLVEPAPQRTEEPEETFARQPDQLMNPAMFRLVHELAIQKDMRNLIRVAK